MACSTEMHVFPYRLFWQIDQQYCFGKADRQPVSCGLFFRPIFEVEGDVNGLVMDYDVSNRVAVFDLQLLALSITHAGRFQLVNCECGIPDDNDIMEDILVVHRGDEIIWQFSDAMLRHILLGCEFVEGQKITSCLSFSRERYIADIQLMYAQARKIHQQLMIDEIAPGDDVFIQQLLETDFDPLRIC